MKNNKETKNYVVIILVLIVLGITIISVLSVINITTNNKLTGKASIDKCIVVKASSSLKHVFGIKTKFDDKKNNCSYDIVDADDNRNSLQGSAGYKKKIYYVRAKSGFGSLVNGKYYHYNTTYSYDTKTKKIKIIDDFDEFYKKNTEYKANDITIVDGVIYELAMDASDYNEVTRKGSKLLYNDKKLKVYSFIDDMEFTNFGYNATNKNFYSLYYKTMEVYKYNLSDNLSNDVISPTKICNFNKLYYDEKGNTIIGNYNNGVITNGNKKIKVDKSYKTVYQGIVMKGYLMYVPRQSMKVTYQTVNGKKEVKYKEYTNYIDVYDTRNCNSSNKSINYSYSMKIGDTNKTKQPGEIKAFELESLFFMSSKLYLGYNNSKARGIDFYNINFKKNIIDAPVKISHSNNTITLSSNITSKYKIYAYKFCKNKDGKDCDYKGYKDKDGNYLTSKELTVKKEINDFSSDWYLIIRDLLGNTKTVKISKEQINKKR